MLRYYLPFFGPNIISDGPINSLSIRQFNCHHCLSTQVHQSYQTVHMFYSAPFTSSNLKHLNQSPTKGLYPFMELHVGAISPIN